MPPISALEDVGALWLNTLQRAMGRASHDVRDALNGVSVNLEVVRSRAAKPGATADVVAPYGEAAAQQLERLTGLIDAVLALSRAEREPADVGVTLRRVAVLCSASSSSSDAAVHVLETSALGATLTRVPGTALRLALASPLLDVVVADHAERASDVTCTLSGDDEGVLVTIAAIHRRPAVPDALADVLRTAGVRWNDGAQDLTLTFPRP